MSNAFLSSFTGRRVLVTGHTGFKGSWLSLWLARHGTIIAGYALEPPTAPSNFVASRVESVLAEHHVADIRDRDRLGAVIDRFRPEVILHLAAQTVVIDGYATPAEAFSVNVMGTVTVLDVVRTLGLPCAIVAVSTDKVYANSGTGKPFTEADGLGGRDPYSASKAAAELAVDAYRSSFFPPDSLADHGVALASARAGNVIGGGDWTPYGLVADTFRALAAGRPVEIRYPDAIRPWQHVLEPLAGYLRLAQALRQPDAARFCRSWNFAPEDAGTIDVQHIVEGLIGRWGTGSWRRPARPVGQHEAGVLRLDGDAGRLALDARNAWPVDEAIRRTAAWYRRFADDPGAAREACIADIGAYEQAVGI
jgi:CDP-glucose 4,6-dehydratase